MQDARV